MGAFLKLFLSSRKMQIWYRTESCNRGGQLAANENRGLGAEPTPIKKLDGQPRQRRHYRTHLTHTSYLSTSTRWLLSPASPASAWPSPPRSPPAAPVSARSHWLHDETFRDTLAGAFFVFFFSTLAGGRQGRYPVHSRREGGVGGGDRLALR